MNRKIVGALAIVLFAVSVVAPGMALAREYKIAYADLTKLFDDYSKTKEAEKALADKGKAKEDERKKIFDEIRKMKDELSGKQALLNEKAKADKQAAVDARQRDLQEFERKTREELLKERNDTIGGILKDIERVVIEYSKEEKYDVILNTRTLLYGNEQMDVTGEILKRLNK